MPRTGVSEHYYDPESGGFILNTSGVANDEVMTALWDQHPEVASVIRWANNVQSRQQGLFERDKFVTPLTPYRQMKVAYEAAQIDDVVSNVLESTEAMAFSKMSFECDDPDEQNIWNQLLVDLDLDSRFREMWREIFTISQLYQVVWWGTKTYKVGGKSDKGVSRKKTFTNLTVPTGLTLLDPLKIVPVGNFLFNQENLAYIATRTEAQVFYDVLAGRNTSDLMVTQLILGPYEPDQAERIYLAGMDINPNYLFLLNPNLVWRHTDTRPQYERFANIRMKSIFELLDLKHQLREMDRAWLVGGTNYLVLVTLGTDQIPAKQAEVAALAGQMRIQARVPVIVGDHRLDIKIITPKTEHTLQPAQYNTLDARIEARLYQMFLSSNSAVGRQSDDSLKQARVISRSLEARRRQLNRAFHRAVVKPIFEANPQFTSEPELVFHPKMIALDYDAAFVQLVQDLRDRGDLSRATTLDQFDFDQDEEARKREIEADRFDDTFTPPNNIPFSSPGQPGPASPSPKAAGRRGGGTSNGGGRNVDSTTSNSRPAKPRPGTPKKD